MTRSCCILIMATAVGLLTSVGALGQDQIPTREGVAQNLDRPQFSPYAGRSYPTKVLWGDTHLHTAVSVDAGTMCRLGQEDALRFARGEEVTTTGGLRAKLSRPLDFIVVADHVPMGGDLRAAPAGASPSFLVAALKDSYSGNLDRIQVVKGWLEADGTTAERVYDVAVSDGREIDQNGRCTESVGSTVDVRNATWRNTIGDPELIAVWQDPAFDPQQHAFYYARVIEIPTPRWTAYEAKRFGVDMPEEVPMTTQERAYTSPIWYTP